MDTMTTTQHLGQAPGRARRCAPTTVACVRWHQHLVTNELTLGFAKESKGVSTVAVMPMNSYLGTTSNPAGAQNDSFIKCHARHLGTGST